MKPILTYSTTLIFGVVLGGLLFPSISQSTSDTALDESNQVLQSSISFIPNSVSKKNTVVQGARRTRGITRSEAYDMFYAYHQSNDPAGSKGCLKTTVNDTTEESIVSFFLSDEDLLTPLQRKVENDGKSFVGLAAIPAYIDSLETNTLIVVAIIEESDSQGNRSSYYYLPPDSNSNDATFIYDFIDVCPNDCPENKSRLWNDQWEN